MLARPVELINRRLRARLIDVDPSRVESFHPFQLPRGAQAFETVDQHVTGFLHADDHRRDLSVSFQRANQRALQGRLGQPVPLQPLVQQFQSQRSHFLIWPRGGQGIVPFTGKFKALLCPFPGTRSWGSLEFEDTEKCPGTNTRHTSRPPIHPKP
jgi:hypothetical protein